MLPATAIRPRSGRISPATQLSTVVLPAPDGPTSAVSGASDAKRERDRAARRCGGRARPQRTCARLPAERAHEQLGHHQRGERQRDRDQRQPRHQRLAAGHLQRRCRSPAAASASRPAMFEAKVIVAPNSPSERAKPSTAPAAMPGSAQRQGDRQERPPAARAERARGVDQPPVDRLDRQPHRPHHQRQRHHRRGERRAGPAEHQRDPELRLEPAADRPVAAEQQQQQPAGHHRRHHQRQVDQRVEQDLARETAAAPAARRARRRAAGSARPRPR